MKRFISLPLCIFVSVSFCFFSCKKDQPPQRPNNPAVSAGTSSAGVFICNEGNFNSGGGSVSQYYTATKTVEEDIFKKVNKRSLGDVVQSMNTYNGKGYIVVNNSGKVEVVNLEDFKSSGTITGLASPRYFLPVGNNKAYVSDLYANAVSVVDLVSNTKLKSIPCTGWTEEMLKVNDKIFITNLKRSSLYIANAQSDAIEDSIPVGYAPASMCVDVNNKLWVLCVGDSTKQIKAGLYRINPATNGVEFSVQFPDAADAPKKLVINKTGTALFYLNKGVCKIDIDSPLLPANKFIEQGSGLFYGLGIDANANIIYVSDAVDYVQKGTVYRYNASTGALMDSFKAGIIPGEFCFY